MNYLVHTDPATQYIDALAQGEASSAAVPGLRADGSVRVASLSVRSVENLAWRVEQLDLDGNILTSHQFAVSDGNAKLDSDGVTTYYYYTYTPSKPWGIPHSKSYQSTFAIRNTSADSKTAGSAGELALYLKTCAG